MDAGSVHATMMHAQAAISVARHAEVRERDRAAAGCVDTKPIYSIVII